MLLHLTGFYRRGESLLSVRQPRATVRERMGEVRGRRTEHRHRDRERQLLLVVAWLLNVPATERDRNRDGDRHRHINRQSDGETEN